MSSAHPRPHVRFVKERNSPRGRLYLDGRVIHGVQAVTVEHDYRTLPRVDVTLSAASAVVEYVDDLDEHEEVSTDGTS
ncbi:hypothetical protein ACGFYZ_12860 [Streptomyces sp. NPDC048330]|uniref:hypothetical protein n=1 Tax=Streptomyces sp. NPDC048330 TaxID=3365533 RepID=UPI00371A6E34